MVCFFRVHDDHHYNDDDFICLVVCLHMVMNKPAYWDVILVLIWVLFYLFYYFFLVFSIFFLFIFRIQMLEFCYGLFIFEFFFFLLLRFLSMICVMMCVKWWRIVSLWVFIDMVNVIYTLFHAVLIFILNVEHNW